MLRVGVNRNPDTRGLGDRPQARLGDGATGGVVGVVDDDETRLGADPVHELVDVEKLGRTLFGRNQLIGTAEYSFRVVPMRRFDFWKLSFRLGLEVALFGDVGVAWSESRDLNTKRTRAGGGPSCSAWCTPERTPS